MELTANAEQLVNPNQIILFSDIAIPGNSSMSYRQGSGQVTLKGATCQCRARYKISFGANIGLPAASTAQAQVSANQISLAIALNGEALAPTTMIQTPASTNEYANVFASTFVNVPQGCCSTISVINNGTQALKAVNSNLIIERVA